MDHIIFIFLHVSLFFALKFKIFGASFDRYDVFILFLRSGWFVRCATVLREPVIIKFQLNFFDPSPRTMLLNHPTLPAGSGFSILSFYLPTQAQQSRANRRR